MFQIRMKSSLVAIAVATALAAPLYVSAANTSSEAASPPAPATHAAGNSKGTSRLSSDDRSFAMKAAQAGMGEVELGRLAEQKGENKQVREFGARMVRDHSQANDRLKQIASGKGLQLPTRLDKKDQKDLDQLTKIPGGQFDHAYIKKQVAGHKKVIGEFRKEAKSGHDADLRNFASQTLPTLEEHLKLAQAASQAVQNEASKSASAKAARKATGASHVAAERQEHMPVPKTGM